MAAVHLLTIAEDQRASITCLELGDDCRAYVECHDERCDTEELDKQLYEEGDDEPVLHGMVHYNVPGGWSVALDECFVANSADIDVALEDFPHKEPGQYLVRHEVDGDTGSLEVLELVTAWQAVTPKQAVKLDLSKMPTVHAPLNEEDERCPWPWGPQQLVGVPLGQYHCDYCGAQVLAGVTHLDYAEPELDL